MSQQIAGHSDEVTIEQGLKTVLQFLEIEQGESKGLPVFDVDVFDAIDDMRCACSLFVWGPGNQHRPVGQQPRGGYFLRGEEVRRQGRSVLLLPSLPLGSSSSLQSARRLGTVSTLRVGCLFVSKGGPKLVKWRKRAGKARKPKWPDKRQVSGPK